MERNIESARFVIEAEEVQSMVKNSGLASAVELLPILVPAAQALALPPISKFPVGAVGLGSSGRIFFGVNVEFPGLPLHHSIHAEQFLVTNATIHDEKRISHVAVSALPCGHCRQFLQEMRGASEIRIGVASDPSFAEGFRPLSDFLPHPFGPRDLLDANAPLLLEPRNNKLFILEEKGNERSEVCNGTAGLQEELKTAALKWARRAHAPYSGCPSGFAVGNAGGRVYGGAYAESAAYNPSFGPAQAALVAFIAGGGGGDGRFDYEGIVEAALVEKRGAVVSQEETARMLMAAVAPHCRFRVYRC